MFERVTHAAQDAARRTALGLGAAICLAVGMGFLSAAAFIAMAAAADPVTAALVLGAAYAGLGLILMAFAVQRHRAPPPPVRPPAGPVLLVAAVEAFTAGMAAGKSARSAMTRPR